MGGCLSFKRRSHAAEDKNVEILILAEFEKRCAELLRTSQNVDINVSSGSSGNLSPTTTTLKVGEVHLLEKRLEKLKREKNLSEDGSQEEDEESVWLEAMEYRLHALGAGLPENLNVDSLKNLTKKEIVQLKKAEESIVEFEVRLAKLRRDITL